MAGERQGPQQHPSSDAARTDAVEAEAETALSTTGPHHEQGEWLPRGLLPAPTARGLNRARIGSLQRLVGNAQTIAHVRATHPALPNIQRSPAEDLIAEHTSLLNLREDQLGAALLERARRGEYDLIQQVFDALGSSDRDDVAYELTRRADEPTLGQLAAGGGGRRLLDRLFDELTAGSVAVEEQAQADRIMRAKSHRIGPEQFAQGMANAKVFPYRLPGLTVLNDAPINAERRSEGRIWVNQPVRVLGTETFRGETRTLPSEVFTSGIELPENEIIGVKLYDLGGEVQYRPALYLVQLANETDTTTLMKMGEAAAIGATLGSGALAGLGIEASLAARVLLIADRAAFVIGTITSVIREHRGWIIESGGAFGRLFLRCVDMVHSAVAIYGFARVAIGMAQLMQSLRSNYQSWRSAVQAADGELGQVERGVVQQTSQHVDDLLQQGDEISNARQPQGGAQAGGGGQAQPQGQAAPGAIPPQAQAAPGAVPEPAPSAAPPQGQAAPGAAPPQGQAASGTVPEPAPGAAPPQGQAGGASGAHEDLLNVLQQRQQQLLELRGDPTVFRNTFRQVTADGNTPRSIASLAPRLRQLLTTASRVRQSLGGRTGSSPSTIVESLDGRFSIRITHNQVGANPIGQPPGARIHLYQGEPSGHGSHVRLTDGTTLDDIVNALTGAE